MTYIFIFISNIINTSYPGGAADDGYLPLAKFCVKSPATPIKHRKNHNFSRKNLNLHENFKFLSKLSLNLHKK
jgi:hypothetical protein